MLKMRIKEAAPPGGLFRFAARITGRLPQNYAAPAGKMVRAILKMLHSRHTRPEIVLLSPSAAAIGASAD
jgi:hypothetical protein